MASVTKQLDRKLGFWSVYSIAVGAMLGSGIFVLPGLAAAIAGPWVSLSYLLAGVLVLPAVLSKAELATAMPVAGGSFVYVDRSMGPWLGTVTGIGTWFALSAKTAFALVGLGAYLVLFTTLPTLPVSLGILLLLLLVNFLGAGKVSGLQIAVVTVTVIALLGFAGLAGPITNPTHFEPAFPNGMSGIVAGAGFVFVSYNGVTKICSVAEEVQQPEKNIPLGMLSAQFTVMVLYALISWVCVGHIDPSALEGEITPVATAAGGALGEQGRTVLAVIAIVGLISMCNAGILATSRFPFAMGRARVFPTFFERVSQRFGTPHLSLLATGMLLVSLVLFLPVQKLAKLASGFTIFVFCIVNVAVLVLRESGPRWYAPTFRSPLYPWTQIAGLIGGIWLLSGLGSMAVFAVLGGFVVGTIWYFAYARNRIDRRGALQHLVGERQSVHSTELMEQAVSAPAVVVPVFGVEPAAERLIRLAAAFAQDSELEVIRYEEVSEQTPLSAALSSDPAAEHLAEESALVAREEGIGVHFRNVLTHNAKEAAHHHAVSVEAAWLVWEMPSEDTLRWLVRYPMAWWAAQAPCDQAIFVDRMGEFDGDTSDDFPRIGVIPRPGPHDSLLMHVADRLAATQSNSEVTLVDVQLPGSLRSAEQRASYHAELQRIEKRVMAFMVVEANTYEAAALQASNTFDLLVIEGSPWTGVRTVFTGSPALRIAEKASCSVLSVHAALHRVHARVDWRRLLAEAPTPKVVGLCQINVGQTEGLFDDLAAALSTETGMDAQLINAALCDRQRAQSMALPVGVAVGGISLAADVDRPVIAVATLAGTLPMGRRSRQERVAVDVALVVVAPLRLRADHVAWLACLGEITENHSVLADLRAAQDSPALVEVLVGAFSSDSPA